MFSLASIATMSACIFLFGIFFAVAVNFQDMVKRAEEGVAVTVFFKEGITEEEVESIGDKIAKRAEVAKYVYVSAEEAWSDFKKIYFEGDESLAEGFVNDNPLANSAHYEIYLNDISMQGALVTYLQSIDGVRKVNHSAIAANILSDFNSLISYISIGIIMILLAVSTFLISNTVTIGISVRKEEIAIMKLIGATDYFVRAPFVVEGILIGVIGSALPLALLYFLYSKVIVYIAGEFSFFSNMMHFLPVNQIFETLVPVALILGVGIGFLGSRITIRKHLKV